MSFAVKEDQDRRLVGSVHIPHLGSEHDWSRVVLGILVAATVGVQSLEGLLSLANANATKVPAAALLVAWMGDLARARRWPALTKSSITAMLLLVVVLVSASVNQGPAGILAATVRWMPFLLVTVVMIDLLKRRVDPILVFAGMAIGAAVSATVAVVTFGVFHSTRSRGTMEDPNDLAYVLAACMAFALLLLLRGPRVWVRTLGAVLALLFLAGTATTVSRGGGVAIAAVVLWLIVRRLVSARGLFWSAIVLGAAGYLALMTVGSTIAQATAEKEFIAQYNVDTRQMRWDAALRGLAHQPLFGQGPGGAFENYGRNSDFAEMTVSQAATHNMYIEVASDLGIIGFALFVTLLVFACVGTAKGESCDTFIALSAQGSLVAIISASTFLSEEYYMPVWAMIAVSSALGERDLTTTLSREGDSCVWATDGVLSADGRYRRVAAWRSWR